MVNMDALKAVMVAAGYETEPFQANYLAFCYHKYNSLGNREVALQGLANPGIYPQELLDALAAAEGGEVAPPPVVESPPEVEPPAPEPVPQEPPEEDSVDVVDDSEPEDEE